MARVNNLPAIFVDATENQLGSRRAAEKPAPPFQPPDKPFHAATFREAAQNRTDSALRSRCLHSPSFPQTKQRRRLQHIRR